MLMTGETGALFYGIYIWVVVGNGIRYGTRALIRSHVLSVIGFTGVILTNDFWSAHRTTSVGLLLTLILIPIYTLKFLERLNQDVTHAEEASKAKSHFLAHMSHELRTPLNGVIGASDLILGTPLNAEQKDLVQTLRNSGQMLLKLIENVLDFSKIESGKLVAETVDFDLHGLINGIMDMFASQAEQKGLRLHTQFSAETLFLLRGDSLHLRQIIINLVGNAIKFTKKGMVELRVSTLNQDETTSHLRFEVIDTGIGIAQESQQAIFESFTQADAAITRKYGGTGLGTTIAKQLVQFMGGQIGLTSEVDIGSVFWFELPFEKQPPNHILDAMPTLSHVHAIGVGMNTEERTAIANHLAMWGGRFDHAASLAKFFSHLLQINFNQQQRPVVIGAPQGVEIGRASCRERV
jgi:two-component system sensor histidine kinase RpfC